VTAAPRGPRARFGSRRAGPGPVWDDPNASSTPNEYPPMSAWSARGRSASAHGRPSGRGAAFGARRRQDV